MHANRLARVVVTAFVLAAVHASVSAAECKPDTTATANRNRTLFSGVAAFHFDEVGRSVSVNGTPASMIGGELGVALCRWPAYTVGLGGELLVDLTETSYIAPGSPDFHPPLSLQFSSISLTRRWRNPDIVHPMVSLRAGSVDAEYSYYHRVNGISELHVDGKSSAPFVAPAVGVEISLFKYVTAYIDAGHRFVGRLNFW